jgi:hypothetical protein
MTKHKAQSTKHKAQSTKHKAQSANRKLLVTPDWKRTTCLSDKIEKYNLIVQAHTKLFDQ